MFTVEPIRRPAGRVRIAALCVIGLLGWAALHPVRAQQVGTWSAHTSFRNVIALGASEQTLWAATSGGVFGYDATTGDVQRFTPVNGLSGVQATAICYDPAQDVVWVGYDSGVLDRIDPSNGSVLTFRDIARAAPPNRQINRLYTRNDSLLVATDFGLVVFDAGRGEVRDAYTKLGDFTPATPVNDVTVAPTPDGRAGFWVATETGVAYAPIDAVNLQDPEAWTTEFTAPGTRIPLSIALFAGRIYLGTASDLLVRDAVGTYAPLGLTTRAVTYLRPTSDFLLGVEPFRLLTIDPAGTPRAVLNPAFQTLTSVLRSADGTLWLGDTQTGLIEATLSSAGAFEILQSSRYPNGPADSEFSNLTFDPEGNLWAGGIPSGRRGVYRLAPDGAWTSYTATFFPELADYRAFLGPVYAAPDGTVWVGSEGGGVMQISPDDAFAVFDKSNSTLREPTIIAGDDFVVVRGIAQDDEGRTWVTNTGSAFPLHVRLADGTWEALSSSINNASTFGELFIDSFGQKFITLIDQRDFRNLDGLLVLDTGDTPGNTSDDQQRLFNETGFRGQGLPGRAIHAIAEDHDGRIWLATDDGLAFFINTGIIAADPNATPIWPQLAEFGENENPYLLFGLDINDIAVDPANRLWVAANDGVRLVEELPAGGFVERLHFTAENSPLLSNVVVAVNVDATTGDVYFATDRGMVSYRAEAVTPADEAGDLFVYPNPVRIEGDAPPDIFVEGLVEETEVRIVSVNGTLVAQMTTRGGRIRWDARDTRGQPVPSGIYLVVAVGQNGEGTAYGKVAIIR